MLSVEKCLCRRAICSVRNISVENMSYVGGLYALWINVYVGGLCALWQNVYVMCSVNRRAICSVEKCFVEGYM